MTTMSPPLDMLDGSAGSQGQRSRRWLHVVSHTDPRYGGLSSAVPSLAAALAGHGAMEIDLAAFCAPGEDVQPAALPREHTTFWPTSRLAWLTQRDLAGRLEQLIAGVDGVHVHGLWEQSTAVACRTARRLGKPYLLSAHGMLEPWALEAKRLKKQIYAALLERNNVAQAACLHALTEAEADQYRRFGAKGPIRVIPNAVCLPAAATADAFYRRFPDLEGKRLVLFLSRLHPKKGLDLLIEAWTRVTAAFPKAHLVLAGPDTVGTQAKLVDLLRRHKLEGTVSFTGMLTGELKWSALRAAEGFVLPSYSEGLSMALLEAMGMGLPVIATSACNMPEITGADAGWEIQPSVDAVTDALTALLSQSAEARFLMGRRGADLITTRYSLPGIVQQTCAMYDAVLETPPQLHRAEHSGGAR